MVRVLRWKMEGNGTCLGLSNVQQLRSNAFMMVQNVSSGSGDDEKTSQKAEDPRWFRTRYLQCRRTKWAGHSPLWPTVQWSKSNGVTCLHRSTVTTLTMPITPGEVQRAISKLNSGRACGHDDLPADLLKITADLIAPAIADIFNDALEHHEPLDIGKGVLILLQKPGKPVGPLTSVRPIVLLSALRKTLSLVVLSRIATKVDNFLSPSQSGFRRGRSTADVVFGYRWLCAKAQRQRVTIEFLCIDLSRAFDTIRRDKFLEVLQSFLDEPELRMIRFLLAATSLEPRLSTGDCHAFASTIGTPQGDSLSPVLFIVYLEAALRDLHSRLPPRPPADAKLPLDVEYADDIDFISYSRPYLNEIERIAPVCLVEWSLQINVAKTERTSVSRQVDRTHEPWRTTPQTRLATWRSRRRVPPNATGKCLLPQYVDSLVQRGSD